MKRTRLTIGVSGEVTGTQVESHDFHRYIVAEEWNPLARNFTQIFEIHDPHVNGMYDGVPSPIGSGFKAAKMPLAGNVKPSDVTTIEQPAITGRFIAASQMGG